MTNEERQNKVNQVRLQLDKASQEYATALTVQREAEHRRDLAYRQVETLIREEQDLLLWRHI
jgi:hypothetical protein